MKSTGKIKLPDIDLAALKVYGKVQTKFTNGELDIWTEQDNASVAFRFNADKIRRHCVSLPDKYRLPFRIV